jgi:hypothetical protein
MMRIHEFIISHHLTITIFCHLLHSSLFACLAGCYRHVTLFPRVRSLDLLVRYTFCGHGTTCLSVEGSRWISCLFTVNCLRRLWSACPHFAIATLLPGRAAHLTQSLVIILKFVATHITLSRCVRASLTSCQIVYT